MTELGPEALGTEQKPLDEYFISRDGKLWTPMQIMGTVTDFEGKVKKYILGDDRGNETVEVPAEWFEANMDALRAVPGFEADGSKPTLEDLSDPLEHIGPHVQRVGGTALELESAVSRSEAFDALPLAVQNEVSAYRQIVQAKRRAEVDEDFSYAGELREALYTKKESLSAQAKSFLGL